MFFFFKEFFHREVCTLFPAKRRQFLRKCADLVHFSSFFFFFFSFFSIGVIRGAVSASSSSAVKRTMQKCSGASCTLVALCGNGPIAERPIPLFLSKRQCSNSDIFAICNNDIPFQRRLRIMYPAVFLVFRCTYMHFRNGSWSDNKNVPFHPALFSSRSNFVFFPSLPGSLSLSLLFSPTIFLSVSRSLVPFHASIQLPSTISELLDLVQRFDTY